MSDKVNNFHVLGKNNKNDQRRKVMYICAPINHRNSVKQQLENPVHNSTLQPNETVNDDSTLQPNETVDDEISTNSMDQYMSS